MPKRFLVTGGAGFIGSALVRHLVQDTDHHVMVVDKLTYAGNLESLAPVANDPRYGFVRADIIDRAKMTDVFARFAPDIVMHLAAESHVDRSIDDAAAFITTNIIGTYTLLETALNYWRELPGRQRDAFRFHHISTDEVFGSLGRSGRFSESSPYAPRSPYSASKAAADHLVRSWHHSYGLPVLVTNCSNNYGPYHFPEKLIPLMIINGLEGAKLPLYGDGRHVRDWLYVDDHARALVIAALQGRVGETYCIGGQSERSNLDVVKAICVLLDELVPNVEIGRHERLISFVADRPGHDRRYGIDPDRIRPSLDGNRAKLSTAACAKPSNGIWPTACGGNASALASMAVSGWEFWRDPRLRR